MQVAVDAVKFEKKVRKDSSITTTSTSDKDKIESINTSSSISSSEKAEDKVFGVDLLATDPVEGATIFKADFIDPKFRRFLSRYTGKGGDKPGKVDVVLSDMAPNFTGHYEADVSCDSTK